MELDSELRRQLGALFPEPTRTGDWERVLADEAALPAPGRPRAFWVAVAVLAAAAVLVATAAAFRGTLERIFGAAEPAPARVVLEFSRLDEGAPIGMESHVAAGETRRVARFRRADGTTSALYVAPTAEGGYCVEFEGFAAGCVADRAAYLEQGLLLDITALGARGSTAAIGGSVLAESGAVEVAIVYDDGVRTPLETVWVSEPIRAGFFLAEVPPERRAPGRGPTAVVALDADGEVVERATVGRPG